MFVLIYPGQGKKHPTKSNELHVVKGVLFFGLHHVIHRSRTFGPGPRRTSWFFLPFYAFPLVRRLFAGSPVEPSCAAVVGSCVLVRFSLFGIALFTHFPASVLCFSKVFKSSGLNGRAARGTTFSLLSAAEFFSCTFTASCADLRQVCSFVRISSQHFFVSSVTSGQVSALFHTFSMVAMAVVERAQSLCSHSANLLVLHGGLLLRLCGLAGRGPQALILIGFRLHSVWYVQV